MGLFDDLKDRAGDAVQIAGKKVGEAYGATKLKVQIADKQSQVRALYRELGELVYENSKKDDPDITLVEDKIAEIDLALESVADLKNQERTMKSMVMCINCNADVDSDAKFCPQCGNSME